MLVKGFDGLVETVAGLLFWLVREGALYRAAVFVTRHELARDPHDPLANALRHAIWSLSADTKAFVGAYLVGHGLIKIVLAAGLLSGRRWAYPTALVVLGTFVAYQAHRWLRTRSPALLAFTLLDVVIVLLIWRDWRAHARPNDSRSRPYHPAA